MEISAYQSAFLALLPSGKAWNKNPGSTLNKLSSALSQCIARADDTATQLLEERFPSTSILLLEDWEQFLKLPDCTSESGTVSERQNAAANKMRMVGSLNRRFYEWLMAQYGYNVSLTDSDEGQFTTVVNILDAISYRNATVLDSILTPLRVYESGALECLLEKYKPAHQIFKYVYVDDED